MTYDQTSYTFEGASLSQTSGRLGRECQKKTGKTDDLSTAIKWRNKCAFLSCYKVVTLAAGNQTRRSAIAHKPCCRVGKLWQKYKWTGKWSFIWHKNAGPSFFPFAANLAFDRQTDGQRDRQLYRG